MIDLTLEKDDEKSPLSQESSSPPTYLEMTTHVHKYAKLVEVSIEFLCLGEIDTMRERYEAEVRIKSRWYDDDEIESYDKALHWDPKLFIVNAMPDVKEEIKYRVERCQNKSIITEIRIAKGKFWERIELNDFPIDIQE
jgi:uncharacterized UPF0160 family protein